MLALLSNNSILKNPKFEFKCHRLPTSSSNRHPSSPPPPHTTTLFTHTHANTPPPPPRSSRWSCIFLFLFGWCCLHSCFYGQFKHIPITYMGFNQNQFVCELCCGISGRDIRHTLPSTGHRSLGPQTQTPTSRCRQVVTWRHSALGREGGRWEKGAVIVPRQRR